MESHGVTTEVSCIDIFRGRLDSIVRCVRRRSYQRIYQWNADINRPLFQWIMRHLVLRTSVVEHPAAAKLRSQRGDATTNDINADSLCKAHL
jgi:hypothetical protein